VGLLQGHWVDQAAAAGGRNLDVVAAFLEENCKGLVVVEELQMTPQAQIHNLRFVEERLAHRADLKEDVGMDQDQVANFVLKLVKVEVHTG
jgi:hypothetical protein